MIMGTKWLLVLALTALACARISGLQNDLSPGYSYRQPADVSTLTTVPASLAYYINIPAGQRSVDYYYIVSRPETLNSRYPSVYHAQDVTTQYRQPQYAYNQDLGYNRQQQPDTSRVNVYRPHTPSEQQQQQQQQHLPAVHRAIEFAPVEAGYQVEARSRPQQQPTTTESPFRPQFGKTIPRPVATEQSAPSQELVPPPPYHPSTSQTSQFESKGFSGAVPKQQPAVASLPSSYNAQLPFAFGAVPIKFKPLPLKTHLRQSGLLPITSYQARESYKK